MAIDKGLKSVSVFLDLRKAFDVIRHDAHHAQTHGVKESELRWFNSYLYERSQCVAFKDAPLRLSFDVPQGSVLGPTLFNVHNIYRSYAIFLLSRYTQTTPRCVPVLRTLI